MDRSEEFDFIDSSVQAVENQDFYNTLMQWEVPHHDHLDQAQDDLYAMGSFVNPSFNQTPTPTVSTTIHVLLLVFNFTATLPYRQYWRTNRSR